MSDRRPAHQGDVGEDEAATNISSDTARVLTWEASAVLVSLCFWVSVLTLSRPCGNNQAASPVD
jgi:hypothetical protein